MPKTLCIANQKGGVGKTTTTLNLAAGLAKAGKVTLVVDMDPQCNATTGLGRRPLEQHPLVGEESLRHSLLTTNQEGLMLLPGSRRFRDVELLAHADSDYANRLIEHLNHDTAKFDFVLIDCPPSLGSLTQKALACSDEVLMPIQCEYFAMEGLKQMIELIREIMVGQNQKLSFAGILLTMYDPTLELTKEVEDDVRDFFGEIVFETVIPRDVAVAESPSFGISVLDHAPRSRGTRAYIELCMEVLTNVS
ncbi:MAG TPA: ParA family protein [Pirellulaceae bacterium]|nr:ParA family protein [Pirellulaceae bacterium]HMO92596.1 ParA family protein [Pirellulaceae bacterium]HMP71358.1 ParA family protein [Pirellulaceae bacterium]